MPFPRKPTQVQINEGDPGKHGVRKLDARLAAEPIAEKGLPECPEHLEGRSREAWEFWKLALEGMNLDFKPDAMMLEGACVNYARAVDADTSISREGLMLTVPRFNSKGDQIGERNVAHPLILVSNKSWDRVQKFCSEFGLSPVSRTRLTFEKKADDEADLRQKLNTPRAPREARPAVQ